MKNIKWSYYFDFMSDATWFIIFIGLGNGWSYPTLILIGFMLLEFRNKQILEQIKESAKH